MAEVLLCAAKGSCALVKEELLRVESPAFVLGAVGIVGVATVGVAKLSLAVDDEGADDLSLATACLCGGADVVCPEALPTDVRRERSMEVGALGRQLLPGLEALDKRLLLPLVTTLELLRLLLLLLPLLLLLLLPVGSRVACAARPNS